MTTPFFPKTLVQAFHLNLREGKLTGDDGMALASLMMELSTYYAYKDKVQAGVADSYEATEARTALANAKEAAARLGILLEL